MLVIGLRLVENQGLVKGFVKGSKKATRMSNNQVAFLLLIF
jgi:hypothetical protein